MTTSAGHPRRRQRSTRALVAVLLLTVAALAVVASAVSGSWPAVTAAGGVAVVLGAAATRITHIELLDSRREAARDRAGQAKAFRDLECRRSVEGLEYAADMQGRIARRDATISRLERRLADAAQELADARRGLARVEEQLAYAERDASALAERLADAEERAVQSVVRVAELEVEVETLTAQWQAAETSALAARTIPKGA